MPRISSYGLLTLAVAGYLFAGGAPAWSEPQSNGIERCGLDLAALRCKKGYHLVTDCNEYGYCRSWCSKHGVFMRLFRRT
jgi:hypothetical protein